MSIAGYGDAVFAWYTPRWATAPQRAWRLSRAGRDGEQLLAWLREVGEEMLRKQDRPAVDGQPAAGVVDEAFAGAYPRLWDHLTQERWDDGTTRQLSTFTVFKDGGVFKVMLKDKEAGLCLWVAVQKPIDIFEALEAGLSNPAADWRVDRNAPGKVASRTKRPG